MPTLLSSPRFSVDSQTLWGATLKEDGWEWCRSVRYQVPDDVKDPVVYGEPIFCDFIAGKLHLGLLDPPDDWLANLPQAYTRRRVRAMPALDLASKVTSRSFIKPANDKVFPAGIYEYGTHVPLKHIEGSCPTLVSDVVHFDTEVRCYVLDRRIVTAGLYLTTDNIGEESARRAYEGAQQWLGYLLDQDDIMVELPSAIVIDVGFIENVGWAVIEANPAYSSGIYTRGEGYSANPQKLFPFLERAGGLQSRVQTSDCRFIRPV